MIKLILLTAVLFPVFAMAEDAGPALDLVLGLHPTVPLALGIIWGAMKIADTQISEETKGKWPTWGRKIWDWLLLHIGQSRNAGSRDSKHTATTADPTDA